MLLVSCLTTPFSRIVAPAAMVCGPRKRRQRCSRRKCRARLQVIRQSRIIVGTARASAPIQPIRPAASVILARDTGAPASSAGAGSSFEVLMLRRTANAAFAGGMYVFPGGRVDGDDHLHVYDDYRRGPDAKQAEQQRALGAEWRGFWIAGIRESFEE